MSLLDTCSCTCVTDNLGSVTNYHNPTSQIMQAATLIYLDRRILATHFSKHEEVINNFIKDSKYDNYYNLIQESKK